MQHKWLWIIRHGHAANSLDIPDFERPLTQQGQERALVIGRGIRSTTGAPEFVLTSSAPRATATAKLLVGGSRAVIEEQEHLYMASVDTLLAATWSIPSDIRAAIVVGHNPGVSHLANLLAGQTEYRLPPLGAVCFEVKTRWEDLGSCELRVNRFVNPNADVP